MFIEGSMSPLLQFMNIHVNKPFKDCMKNKWELIEEGEVEYMKPGKRKRPSYDEIAKWVADAWRTISNDLMLKRLAECGYIDLKGNFEDLYVRLRDTIMNREVPIKVILEVDKLLLRPTRI